ncbi:LLM class flavin-dependent oxidoreductase [Paracraurococcus lichenis]|uniref:LLM class flavin-dependent oxidoreductase n=1 Tax=Paracraurococcus lichenis TaxID=3064888 RepID=A0ABT9E982_9PROT|nr:LLM class flavin-dependent oxidoreductase [Paracraurococcus sp. LOR1-02]MDO9712677.1 LLM class flavin-dependent oxidoreductase [Paracraurococcus sp. LOR1-02]
MSERKPQIKLGLSIAGHGYHHSAWLHPSVPPEGINEFGFYLDLTRTAERGLFDMVFLADFVVFSMVDVPKGVLGRSSRGSFEPLTLLAALAPQTECVGLVATASTTFGVPYHVARSFASLDMLSSGRAGWNVVTSFQDEEAANFGSATILEKSSRYDRAEEFVDVVLGLWDSLAPDAYVCDRQSGYLFDPAKVRTLNHVGRHFRVKGPLGTPRSAQGRPVVVQAGASEEGQELAARTADVVYSVQPRLETAQAFYAGLKGRMAKYGRDPDHLKVMPGLLPVLGGTEAEAKRRFREMQELIDPLVGLRYLSAIFGDLSGHPIDGPVPELRKDKQLATRAQLILDLARRNNWSIRQLYESTAIGNTHNTVVGTPEQVADVMEAWILGRGADGFNLLPALSPLSVQEFVDEVVPVLQRRGLYRREYEARTLRENLGLPAPPTAH